MSPTRKRKAPRQRRKAPRPKQETLPFESAHVTNIEQGRLALQWLIAPVSLQHFFSTYFEKKPLLLRNARCKFDSLTSLDEVKHLVTSGKLQYGKHVDVTSYDAHGGRQTLNGQGVCGEKAWKQLEQNGCSIRMLRPQEHVEAIYRVCAHLEAFVECMVGANVYVTPAQSQGFAPHFDDIDAFVCQVEGRKRWRVYKRREDGLDELPRKSSIDFEQQEVEKGGRCVDTVLEQGDMLYMPRGYVHQAESCELRSVHVTLSMFQQWTWADLLLQSFRTAIEQHAVRDVRLRRSLPLRFTSYMGVCHSAAGATASKRKKRRMFEQSFRRVLDAVGEHYALDTAADEMACKFMAARLPPPCVAEAGVDADEDEEAAVAAAETVSDESAVRAVGGGVGRVCMRPDGVASVTSCARNSRGSGGVRAQTWTCLPHEAHAVNSVLQSHAHALRVRRVRMRSARDRKDLVRALVDMRLARVLSVSPSAPRPC
ncbi:unnamed protein product [Agarophyton chilense]